MEEKHNIVTNIIDDYEDGVGIYYLSSSEIIKASLPEKELRILEQEKTIQVIILDEIEYCKMFDYDALVIVVPVQLNDIIKLIGKLGKEEVFTEIEISCSNRGTIIK